MQRVVITGMGALTPVGNSVNDYWQALLNGVNGAAPITKFDASKFKTRFAGEVKNFDVLNFMDKSEARKHDLFTQYALVTVDEAVKNAEINFEKLNRNRIGVIWGSGKGGSGSFQADIIEFAKGNGTPRFNPFFIPKTIIDIAPGLISIKYGLKGLNYATVSACASSNSALIDAFNYIRWGRADMIIAGGSEAPINECSVAGFNGMKSLSTLNECPTMASRPFDVSRDGFMIAEGAGALILESYEHAVKRNAPILCEIVGGGMASDAYHLTGTSPDGEGAALGMLDALADANLQADDIDYINAHATSTPMGDLTELHAIERVFGAKPRAHISASKSMTGHLLGAAGAIEAIAAAKAIQENMIPPTINTKNPEPAFAGKFDLTLNRAVKRTVNYVMSNTFGFGGHIAVTIFAKWNN